MPQERKRLGRPTKWAKRTPIRFAEGVFDRIAGVLMPSEDRSDFIRTAVDRELERRETLRSQGHPS